MNIEKFTFGMGDRFAHQGRAQLQAVVQAKQLGLDVHPVWNKSNREHTIIHSRPDDVRAEADAATARPGLERGVLRGRRPHRAEDGGPVHLRRAISTRSTWRTSPANRRRRSRIEQFVDGNAFATPVSLARARASTSPLMLGEDTVRAAAGKFLLAMQEAGRIYRHIEAKKGQRQLRDRGVHRRDRQRRRTRSSCS